MTTATQTNVTISEKQLVRYEYRPLLGLIASKTEVSKRALMDKINEIIDVINAMREVPNVCAHTYKHNGFAYVCQNCGKAEITR